MSEPFRVFSIGLDVGQRVDHSAVCLVEVLEQRAIARALVKYPLGTGFPEVVDTCIDLYNDAKGKGEVRYFVVDATGIGAAPAEMLHRKLPEMRIEPFIFTNKSKRQLVGKVKMMHSFGQLKFATQKGDELYNRTLSELITEMKQIQLKVIRDDESNPEIEVFKTGAHDDLFTALALAVKNLNFDRGAAGMQFVDDDTWAKTPLDTNDSRAPPQVLFF